MHFEVLVEDLSGSIAIEALLKSFFIGNPEITFRIIPYKGIGRIPSNLHHHADPKKRILLEKLAKLLQGYGRSLAYSDAAVIVIIDLDCRDCREFKEELLAVLASCNPAPQTLFRIAIEEIEAWYLGDHEAIKEAYPKAKINTLTDYRQDGICGTWEKLADAVYPGGSQKLIPK